MAGNEAVVAQGVVFGADGSDPNLAALGWSADAAAAHRLPLTLLHARPDVAGVIQEVREGSPVLNAAAQLVQDRHPDLTVTSVQSPDPPVPVRFVAGSGRPAAVLDRESVGCELLVVGMRGLGGFSGLVMESVSQKVLTDATCPVAIVHEAVSARTAAGMPS